MESMELHEIDLWELIQVISRRKYFIIGIMLIAICSSYLISAFVLEEIYQSEMWVKISDNYILWPNGGTINFFESYGSYPEVIKDIQLNGELSELSTEDLKFEKVDNMVKITLMHAEHMNVSDILNAWSSSMKRKMIIDATMGLFPSLKSELTSLSLVLEKNEERYKNIQALLTEEGKFVEVEVFPKESPIAEPVVFKELNPNYTKLKQEENYLKLGIVESKKQIIFLDTLLKDYQDIFDAIKQEKVYNLEQNFYALEQLEISYNTYLHVYKSKPAVSLIPYKQISAPNTFLNPVKPDIKLIVLFATILGCFIGIFLVVFKDYVEKNIEHPKNRTL